MTRGAARLRLRGGRWATSYRRRKVWQCCFHGVTPVNAAPVCFGHSSRSRISEIFSAAPPTVIADFRFMAITIGASIRRGVEDRFIDVATAKLLEGAGQPSGRTRHVESQVSASAISLR